MTTSVLYLGCPAPERQETERLLGAANVGVVWADNVSYALSELQRRDMPVLLDLSRGAAALQSAREIRTRRASTLMFAVVDARRPELTTEAVLAGMADVFARPLGGRRVANAIVREQRYELRQRGSSTDDLYGHSPAMRDVVAMVARAATMRAGVLIRGEEGTGRQLVARAIHALHADNPAAIVVVDCAACDGDQLEAALFGAAARTSSGDQARGLERVGADGQLHGARGGTLYLQNIAEAPARVQMRLSRLLRDREAVLAESDQTIDFDVRPMTGVSPGFDSAVDEGRVRADLVRRLSVLRIDVPPLRQRREDIAALANYFLREICASRPVPPKTFSRSALSLLAALPWRGNAAELQSVLSAVVAGIHDTRSITLDDVLAHVRLDGAGPSFGSAGTLKQARARFERDYIASMLERHRGRISDAAKALGIQRTNLYRKMRALRVNRGR
jgi:two-component system nitrogen regulation response regulator NtrX